MRSLKKWLTLLFIVCLTSLLTGKTVLAASWTLCGTNSNTCANPNGGTVVTRFGVGDEKTGFYYMVYDGATSLDCQNGDPNAGASKNCYYTANTPDNVGFNTHPTKPTTNLTTCAENATCSIATMTGDTSGMPYWVKFVNTAGTKSTTGIASDSFVCSNNYFGTNPDSSSAKKCVVIGPALQKLPASTDWVTCATENNACTINTNQTVLFRYGDSVAKKLVYRLIGNASGHTIGCENTHAAGYDPAVGGTKTCSYVPFNTGTVFQDGISHPSGGWSIAQDLICDNQLSCATSLAAAYGTSVSSSSETSKEWGNALTVSMTYGFSGLFVSSEYSISNTVSYSQSQSFTKARDTSYSVTQTVSCGTPSQAGHLQVWQFEINSNKACLATGDCNGTVYTQDVRCLFNKPYTYTGPQCLPNDCIDYACTACYSTGDIDLTVNVASSTTGGAGTVTSNTVGTSSINCTNANQPCEMAFKDHATLTLTATPDGASQFSGWSGDCLGTGSCVISSSTVGKKANVTATFAPRPVTPQLADLTVTGISLTPATPTVGTAFTANITVTNNGVVSSPATSLKVWANTSTQPSCTTSATGSVSASINALAVGASQTIAVKMPAPTAIGAAQLWALADSACAISESNENNNTLSAIYSVQQSTQTAQADLLITGVTLPTTITHNVAFTANVTVKNQGKADVASTVLRVWKSSTIAPTCTSDITNSATKTITGLTAGSSKTVTFSLAVATTGAKQLRALIDSSCAITESNETNNTFAKAYTAK